MKRWSWLAVGAVLMTSPVLAQNADEPGVRAAFQHYDDGWRRFDLAEVVDAFADDFEWVNSVGLRIADKPRLTRFVTHLFADADFRAGTPGPTTITSIRFLAPDVATVMSAQITNGQKDYKTGKVVPEQRTNELTVMRRVGGHWLIVEDITSDESHGI